MTRTTVHLVRHGEVFNPEGILYGRLPGYELSALGHEQADRVAAWTAGQDVAVVVASPLERAQQTAWAAADELGLEVETVDGLIEMSFGDWDGLTFSQAHDADPELHTAWLTDTSVTPPNGESLQHAFRRVRGTLDELRTRYEGKTVLVVSHVTPIKAILRGRARRAGGRLPPPAPGPGLIVDRGVLLRRAHLRPPHQRHLAPRRPGLARALSPTPGDGVRCRTRMSRLDDRGGVDRRLRVPAPRRGKSGLRRARWLLTATRGNPRDSATESRPPGRPGKGETVR